MNYVTAGIVFAMIHDAVGPQLEDLMIVDTYPEVPGGAPAVYTIMATPKGGHGTHITDPADGRRFIERMQQGTRSEEAEMAMKAIVHVHFTGGARRWRARDANLRRSTGAELILEADGTGTLAVWAPEAERDDPYDLALTRTQVDQLREVLGPPVQHDPDEPFIDNSRPRDQLFRSNEGGT